MLRRKNTCELGMLTMQNPSDHHYLGQISIDSIEPELQSLTSICLYAYSAQCHDSAPAQNRAHFKDYSVSKEWHRPYVEALLELLIASVETDEILDLQNAAHAITELKKASAVAYTPQHLVA
jgi:hypothetical protein